MQFPGFRSSNKARKRTVVAAALAVALGGGLIVTSATQASAAPSANCRVQGPAQGSDAAWTDPNSNDKFKNIYWCETQSDANVHPPSDHTDTTPFGILHKSPQGQQNNYIVCYSSSLPTQLNGGYYWMLTEADAPLAGQESRYDLDTTRADASADRVGWVSSQILGIDAGDKPLNIAECGSAGPEQTQAAGGTRAGSDPNRATTRESGNGGSASGPRQQNVTEEVVTRKEQLRRIYLEALQTWDESGTRADWVKAEEARSAWERA